jgi:predicted MPP superfamily phosphohydrolase
VIIGALLHPVVPGGWLTVAAMAVTATAPLAVLVRGFTRSRYRSAFTRLFILRPFWYVQLLLPLAAGAGLLGALGGWAFGVPGAAGRVTMLIVTAVLILIGLWGYIGARRVVVRSFELEFDSLPPAFDGMRIAQVSDLHVGPHTSRRHLERIATAIRNAHPDLIAITGDQVDDYAGDVDHFVAAFRTLSAPLGVFVIPGNHDVYAGWDAVRRGLETAGFRVLVNDAVPLERHGDRLWVAGTGDPAGRSWARGNATGAGPDIDRTVARIKRDEFVVALAHNPALWPALAKRGVHLTLSGHTHHGQFSIPALGWSLASPFLEHAMGTYREGTSVLYINPGTNYWGVPFRIGALPEVTVVTLRRAEQVADSERVA